MTEGDKLNEIFKAVFRIEGKLDTLESRIARNERDIQTFNSDLDCLRKDGCPLRTKDYLGICALFFTFGGLIAGVIQAIK